MTTGVPSRPTTNGLRNRPTRHLATDRAGLHPLCGYLGLYLAKTASFCYCSAEPVISESPYAEP
jgi:hypothetical protein